MRSRQRPTPRCKARLIFQLPLLRPGNISVCLRAVLNVGGNSIAESAENLNSLARSVAKTLQLLSLRGVKVDKTLTPALCDGLADSNACVDLTGLRFAGDISGSVQIGEGAPQALVLHDIEAAQAAEVLGQVALASSCKSLSCAVCGRKQALTAVEIWQAET